MDLREEAARLVAAQQAQERAREAESQRINAELGSAPRHPTLVQLAQFLIEQQVPQRPLYWYVGEDRVRVNSFWSGPSYVPVHRYSPIGESCWGIVVTVPAQHDYGNSFGLLIALRQDGSLFLEEGSIGGFLRTVVDYTLKVRSYGGKRDETRYPLRLEGVQPGTDIIWLDAKLYQSRPLQARGRLDSVASLSVGDFATQVAVQVLRGEMHSGGLRFTGAK